MKMSAGICRDEDKVCLRSGDILARANTTSGTEGIGMQVFSELAVLVYPSLGVEALWIGEIFRITSDRPGHVDNF